MTPKRSSGTGCRPRGRRLLVALALAASLALGAAADAARADGDPASDYLLSRDVFVPFDHQPSPTLVKQLSAMTADAKSKGYPIRVALIATPTDLGLVGSLWQKPQPYAHFLAQELSFVYRGRLLIVMPNGFGFEHLGHATSKEKRTLTRLKVMPGGDGLARSAMTAVQRLAATDGVTLERPSAGSASSGQNRDRLVIVLVSVTALLALGAARVLFSRLRRRSRAGAAGPVE